VVTDRSAVVPALLEIADVDVAGWFSDLWDALTPSGSATCWPAGQ